ncbi:Phox Homology domain-containing protein [Candidatus Nanopelagicus hibericus]|uniref:Phox Homology domain-containing protein n=1 Tax=Candidatus Nanopelagicus hibericus TaxID=1884915 RepID=A0A249K8P9_9ACTN|nr:hypothetical protein [Candidatus Nanopelagicus hibericus]ASY13168.1 Phox Homology domain-containing protein [Candidatus Nanopelagicus hibericus]
MANEKIKFSSQLDPKVLSSAKKLAKSEGRQLQSIIEQALTDYLKINEGQKPSGEVIDAFKASFEEFTDLYQKLAGILPAK